MQGRSSSQQSPRCQSAGNTVRQTRLLRGYREPQDHNLPALEGEEEEGREKRRRGRRGGRGEGEEGREKRRRGGRRGEGEGEQEDGEVEEVEGKVRRGGGGEGEKEGRGGEEREEEEEQGGEGERNSLSPMNFVSEPDSVQSNPYVPLR